MIDPESQKFMDEAFELLDNDDEYYAMIFAVVKEVREHFQNTPKEIIIERLKKKLTQGAIEHGSPDHYTIEQVEEEKKKEFDDLIGWTLILNHTKKLIKEHQ